MLWGLTVDQILRICQFAIFPALWWATKWAARKIAQEVNEAVDARADAVALKRTGELKNTLEQIKESFNQQFALHETKDVQRYNDLVELISSSGGNSK